MLQISNTNDTFFFPKANLFQIHNASLSIQFKKAVIKVESPHEKNSAKNQLNDTAVLFHEG